MPKALLARIYKLSKRASGGLCLKFRGGNEMRPVHPLASRAVEQDGVGFCFPNGCKLYRAGTMQTKIDAARLAAAKQYSLGDIENIDLQFVVFADCVMNIPSQVVQVVNWERCCRHRRWRLLYLERPRHRDASIVWGVIKEGECQQELLSVRWVE